MAVALQSAYDSLEKIRDYVDSKTDMTCSIQQDQWPTDGALTLTPGQQCLVIARGATAGAKVSFIESSTVEIYPIAPSTFFNSLTRRGLLALIVHAVIRSGQQKVAEEVTALLTEIAQQ